MRKHLLLALGLLLLGAPARALELSLEENRGESGSVGYVDIEKVFKEYPETKRAKDAFKAELERKEKTLLDRKKAIFALRGDISRMKLEREFSLRLSSGLAASKLPPAPPPAPAAEATVSSPAAAADAFMPDIAPDQQPVIVSSASVSDETVVFSTDTMSPVVSLDDKIARAQNRLVAMEADFQKFQAATEKEMGAFENRKTEIILGKIYYALRELSVEQSISVVVDKKNILYGQKAVDLTDKLLFKLRGY